MFPTYDVVFGASPINWCEADSNFSVGSFRMGEFHNTITNASYIVAALILLTKWNNKISGIFLFYCLSLMLTGIASAAFHGHLIWITQKADEIFENWTVLTVFHVVLDPYGSLANIQLRIFIHSILVALGIWCIPIIFCEIHLILISVGVVVSIYRSTNLNLYEKNLNRHIAFLAALGFLSWLLDFFICETFGWLLLHAYGWHILTGLALYYTGLLLHNILSRRYKIKKSEK